MSKTFGGRYEVLEQIGSGGMAVVYKAKDLLLNRVVTIKLLREQFLTDEEFVRRFRREAQAAASLSHPNIVSIYDVGKDGNVEYIVMEYVEGRTLKEIIRDYAPLSTEQAINVARQVAEAINHAHQHHIIHRDIKPQNILVTAEGRAKVTDFGIARAVSAATVTHTGDIVGSVHYLSPEQAKGIQSNEQSDIYSLGIIVYELLTGKVPYDGETPISIALKHLQELPVAPSKLNPRVSKELEAVIMRAIAKSCDERYASAQELLEDLDHVRSGRVPVGGNYALLENDLQATQIHRSMRQSLDTEIVGGRETKLGHKRKKWPWVVGIVVLLLVLAGFGSVWWLRGYLRTEDTTVPSLTGLTYNDAVNIAKTFKLTINPNYTQEFSDTVDSGRIIRQEPQANTPVKAGNQITVWVSKGPEMLKMPDVVAQQLTKDNATSYLSNWGFTGTPKFVSKTGTGKPAGIVVDQNPAAGALLPRNGNITLTVSADQAVQTFPLPDVTGKTLADARKLLEQAPYNLVIVDIKYPNSTVFPKDVVMETTPAPQSPVKAGDPITIRVSDGPGPLG